MALSDITTETWGQPGIYCYHLESDGVSLFGTEIYEPEDSTLIPTEYPSGLLYLSSEELADMEIYARTVNEPTISWGELKEQLKQDGLL
jgi:hypothetical protein